LKWRRPATMGGYFHRLKFDWAFQVSPKFAVFSFTRAPVCMCACVFFGWVWGGVNLLVSWIVMILLLLLLLRQI
jgi:hypothetical protein